MSGPGRPTSQRAGPARLLRLVRPGPAPLAGCLAAPERGWSPDNLRGALAAEEQRVQIAADPDALLALMEDPEGAAPPVTLPDGIQRARISSLRRAAQPAKR